MLYPKNNKMNLEKEVFENPTSEYRGTPFWAWNCKLDKEMLLKQIHQLKEMGMGGFHIHCRTGMDTEYLSEEFMDIVKSCNKKAKEEEMLCWLYDEDRWPSGSAGGLVTKEEKYRGRFLVFTPKEQAEKVQASEAYTSTGKANRSGDGYCLGRYEVVLEDGYLKQYKKLKEGEKPCDGAKLWFAYLEVSGVNPWFNNQAYVNTLDKEAIKKFIEITHEAYYKALGEEFGKSVPAIFTDEPQFSHKQCLNYAEEEKDIIMPFTDDFEDTFKAAYGDSILEKLPELFWELPKGAVSVARYRYHDHLSERFVEAFADTIGTWCKEHNIMLTGHMMSEQSLMSQSAALGEAMRSYRAFQLPGIDILCDHREYTTAKQAQSAAHQYGRPGVLSELYGVTNWDYDFRGHKLQGDWQAALGVSVRVHHLTWVSMGGEAKRDYPASIGYQSPWYKEYPLIENHFSRLNTALTRGKAHIKIGVIHPIESYWLHFGPTEQTGLKREELDNNFKNITEWLLFGLVDYNFISESLLPSLCEVEETPSLKVGEMNYDVILVPGCETLRSTTVERLEAFAKAGGKLIFIGEPTEFVDAVKSERVNKLAESCIRIPFTKGRIIDSLETYRDIDITNSLGKRCGNLIYQMREDNEKRWLFICHGTKMEYQDISSAEKITIKIKGSWKPVVYDTMSGEIYNCEAIVKCGNTHIKHEFYGHDSLLLCLEPIGAEKIVDISTGEINVSDSEIETKLFNEAVAVTLSEANVLLLDMAEYSFDGGEWSAREEILRIDNKFRKLLGYPLRMEALAQPWTDTRKEFEAHTLSLKFKIETEIEVIKPYIALENSEATEIIVNGQGVSSTAEGWFVDECIKKVQLPSLPIGESEIILNIAFTPKSNVEWCYLLGDFGVKVQGSHAKIINPVRTLSFGDWTNQGLPFYAGNVTYHCKTKVAQGDLELETSHFRTPLLSVALDGEEKGKIAFAPYKLKLGKVCEGEHNIDITAYGNRINAFGTLHNCDASTIWYGPNAWRTTGSSWSYEHQLKPMGVLVSPRIYTHRLNTRHIQKK
jgi:hypothetical protein